MATNQGVGDSNSSGRSKYSRCSSVWSERLVWDQEAQGSNPCIETKIMPRYPSGLRERIANPLFREFKSHPRFQIMHPWRSGSAALLHGDGRRFNPVRMYQIQCPCTLIGSAACLRGKWLGIRIPPWAPDLRMPDGVLQHIKS